MFTTSNQLGNFTCFRLNSFLTLSSFSGRAHDQEFYSTAAPANTSFSKGGYGAFQPSRPIRASLQSNRRVPPGQFATRNTSQSWPNRSEQANIKPRVITVVRQSNDKPSTNIKILLNRRTVQSYEQMIKDISEAFGPKWRNNKVKKLFSLKGKEVQGVNEFFREDDVFIAVGNESLSSGDIQQVLHDLYPDHPQARNMVKDMEKKKRRERPPLVRTREFDDVKDDATTTSKRDSGFGSDSSNRDDGERDEIYYEGTSNKGRKKYGHEYDSHSRLERERQRASETEREKAKRKMQKKLEAEQRALEEDKRRKGLLPLKPIQERDSFRKIQEERERERRKKEAERRLREVEERSRREDDERRRKKEEPKVIVVVKEDDKSKRKNKRTARSQEDGYETDDDGSHRTPVRVKPAPRSNFDSAFDNYDSEEDRENLKKEQEEKEKAQREKEAKEKAERERKEREKREREEKEREEREKKERDERDRKEREEAERKEIEAKEQREREEKQRKEQEEKDRRAKEEQEKERKRIEQEKKEREEKEKKEKEQREKLKKKSGKTKMERQISNMTHVMEKYEPGRTLGDGNFAIVKQCKLKSPPQGGNSPDFAMKIIDKSKLKGKEHMIENEIEIMRICDQPNIVKLVDEFETKDEIYLIMELVKVGILFNLKRYHRA